MRCTRPNPTWLRRLWPLAVVPGLWLVGGCGPGNDNTLTGKVTYNGEPLSGGKIHLRPPGALATGAGDIIGDIKQDGAFSISGVPAANMQVGIETESINPDKVKDYTQGMKPPPGVQAPPTGSGPKPLGTYKPIDPKYADPAGSGLTWDVKKEGLKKDFTLTGP